MDNIVDLTNVFGVVGALGVGTTIALWKAWAKERQERQGDWLKFDTSLRGAHEQIIEQMELRLAAQGDMLEKYGELNAAIKRIDQRS